MHIDSNTCMAQLNAVKGVVRARHYVVPLRKIQEVLQLGIIHTRRVDSADNVADMFTKALPADGFWDLSSRAMGDRHVPHRNADLRDMLLDRRASGGSVRAARKALAEQAKTERDAARAAEKETKRREQRDAKQLQAMCNLMTTTLMTRLMSQMSPGAMNERESRRALSRHDVTPF